MSLLWIESEKLFLYWWQTQDYFQSSHFNMIWSISSSKYPCTRSFWDPYAYVIYWLPRWHEPNPIRPTNGRRMRTKKRPYTLTLTINSNIERRIYSGYFVCILYHIKFLRSSYCFQLYRLRLAIFLVIFIIYVIFHERWVHQNVAKMNKATDSFSLFTWQHCGYSLYCISATSFD